PRNKPRRMKPAAIVTILSTGRDVMALAEATQTPWFENPARACCGASQESFDTFFTETPENLLYVRRNYCYGCPVWQQCEDWSLSNFGKVPHGIFAGWTGEQRKLLIGRPRLRHWRTQDWTSERFQDRERVQLRMHEVKVVHIAG